MDRAGSRRCGGRVAGALLLLAALGGAMPMPALAADQAAGADTEQQAADKRIATLQGALGITAAQMPEWTVFAQAMRDNAAATDALFRNRATDAAGMSAADNMRSYASVARAYADDTQKLSDAFQALYGTLDDTQKHAADALFRQQAAHEAGAAK